MEKLARYKNLFIFIGVILLMSITMIWTFRAGGILNIQHKVVKNVGHTPDFSFSEVVISEIAGSDKFWEIKAKHAEINKKKAVMHVVDGTIFQKNKSSLLFKAPKANTDLEEGNFILYKVKARSVKNRRNPWQLETPLLKWNKKRELLKGYKKTRIWRKESSFTGDRFYGNLSFSKFTLKKKVSGKINPFMKKLRTVRPTENIQFFGQELVFHGDSNLITSSGDIRLIYEDVKAKCRNIVINNKKQLFTLNEKVVLEQQNSEIKKAVIRAAKADYLYKKDEIHFYGNVEFNYDDIACIADSAVYMKKNKYLEFKGNVDARKKDKKFFGEKIKIYLDSKRIVSVGRSKFIAPK
jgi:LPS export ABC transporter protein LptC